MRRRTFAVIVLSLSTTVGACGGSGGSPSAPSSANPAPTGIYVDLPPTTVGMLPNSNVGNTTPFGGGGSGNFAKTTYQQVYNAGLFESGQLRMMGVEFFVVPSAARNPQVVTADYTFSLSSTAAQVDALNTTNFAANVGSNNQVVFSGTLGPGSIVDNVFSVAFTTPFVYTTTSGNLLLQVLRRNASPPEFGPGFYNHQPNDGSQRGLSSRASDFSNGHAGFYLVTKFHHQRCQCPTAAPCSC